MSTNKPPLPPIRFAELAAALLQSADRLVPAWLPGGVVVGHEYVCGSLSGGKGTSCSINLTTGKWADFAADDSGGDLLSLYAAIHGLSQAKAALQVAKEESLESVAGIVSAGFTAAPTPKPPQPPPAKPAPAGRSSEEGWRTIRPVPSTAVAPTFKHHHRAKEDIEHTAAYQLGADLHGYVVRFRTSDGGKDTLPYTWCESARDGGAKWQWRQWDVPRPLYLPGQRLPEGRTVVLVEGEPKAEVLQGLLDAGAPGVYCVVSWPGGCKVWNRAAWGWLAGATVLLWPDCDAKHEPLTAAQRKATPDKLAQQVLLQANPLLPPEKQPGMVAMLGIGALLKTQHSCMVQLLPIPTPGTVVDGWDCRDAIVTDGWGLAEVLAFFATAQDLPTAPPVPTPAGTKIEPPVATEGADSGRGDGDDLIGGKRIPHWLRPYYDDEKTRWMVSRKLVITALQRDPALRDVLAFNELTNNIQARNAWPWPHGRAGDVGTAVDLLLGQYLTETYGLPSISRAALSEAIMTVANMQRWHPIRDFLQGLQWDGTSRIDKWLLHALGESPDTISPAMQEYLGLVGRYWLLGMVNRVMQPGCKFDYCPVLEGAGGLRKSTLVEVLAGSEYFSDTPFEVGKGKEAQEQVQGLWLYEIAELTHFSKAEVGAIKAFISSKADRYRVAYGSTVETFPRQCILVGTTNENTYLRDRTGNRRFWPIPVRHVINTDWVTKYRAQLLAEAFALYQQGTRYTPTPEQEARLFAPMQESRLQESAVEVELMTILTRPPGPTGSAAEVNELTDFVTLPQLVQALNVDVGKSTKGLQLEITAWLGHEGWVHGKRQIGGVRKSGYTRPANWPAKTDSDMQVSPPATAGTGTMGSTFTQAGDDAPF